MIDVANSAVTWNCPICPAGSPTTLCRRQALLRHLRQRHGLLARSASALADEARLRFIVKAAQAVPASAGAS